jgi:hypothetical protein
MLKTPTDRGGICHFQRTKRGGCVAAISVATRYGLNYGCIELLATLHCGALIVCKEAIVAVTPRRFRKLSVMSFLAPGALMISLGSA